ncbi:adenine nucleotide alpha hydrolase-like domain kinase [Medicago truncatula]|uniref:RING-type E3 ubiquitin transferase n=1 Tax=Medicago truncatula TaxID=3880 RepID=G7LIV5_MEDTR|nr:adenine nucleotide alpha hydrolase-like domain kinase [Medicago truncatula]
MSRSIQEKKLAAGRVVAVAIENNKTSQYAAKWAVDNLLPKDQHLLLVHVRQKASSIPTTSRAYMRQMDNESKELFSSFRVFCNRKNILCKEVLLEDMDVSKAIIEGIREYSIELLVLGAPSRSGLVRRFRTSDVPSLVSKGAPEFCTVYIISKGKIQSVKTATSPLTLKAMPRNALQPPQQPQQSPNRIDVQQQKRNHPLRCISPFTRGARPTHISYESSISDSDISFVSSGRPSIDRMFHSLYEEMDSGNGITPRISGSSDYDLRSFGSLYSGVKSIDHNDYSFTSQGSGRSGMSMSSQSRISNSDKVEAEMRRLRLELKQTMEMYSTACKEALTAKQKALELQRWKLDEERKMEDTRFCEETSLAVAEKERAKCKVAMEAAEASRKIAELEAQKRMKVEIKSNSDSDQRKRTFGDSVLNSPARYRRYTIEEIEEATNYFSNSLKIGEGGYGPVYRAELDHTAVAIKVLKPDAAQGRSQFQQEVEVLSSIRHPHMVLLLGACPEFGCLVYEHMTNGSLDDCLFRRNNSKLPVLPWQLRFRIAAEIATGLLFLHQTKPEPLVHRDLKPGNILLDRNYVSKISDVGLARLVPPSVADTVTQYRMTATAGTFCYIDPEYQQTGMLGTKSDIYSLGIMLLQMITARPPMGLSHHVARSIEKGTFDEMLDPAVEDWPIEQAMHFAKLAIQCAEMRRKDRPDLGKVILPELNKLRDFADENMPMMMMMFGGGAGFAQRNNNYSRSRFSSSIQGSMSESQSLSEMSGYEGRSSSTSVGKM